MRHRRTAQRDDRRSARSLPSSLTISGTRSRARAATPGRTRSPIAGQRAPASGAPVVLPTLRGSVAVPYDLLAVTPRRIHLVESRDPACSPEADKRRRHIQLPTPSRPVTPQEYASTGGDNLVGTRRIFPRRMCRQNVRQIPTGDSCVGESYLSCRARARIRWNPPDSRSRSPGRSSMPVGMATRPPASVHRRSTMIDAPHAAGTSEPRGIVPALLDELPRIAGRPRWLWRDLPWSIVRVGERLELTLDHLREELVVDRANREVIMACGAVIENLLIVAHHRGRRVDAESLARRRGGGDGGGVHPRCAGRPAARGRGPLRGAGELRGARSRGRRRCAGVVAASPALIAVLRHAARSAGGWLDVVADDARRAMLADLESEGEGIADAEHGARRILRAQRGAIGGGLCRGDRRGPALAELLATAWAPTCSRRTSGQRRVRTTTRGPTIDAPILAVLGTDRDDPDRMAARGHRAAARPPARLGAGTARDVPQCAAASSAAARRDALDPLWRRGRRTQSFDSTSKRLTRVEPPAASACAARRRPDRLGSAAHGGRTRRQRRRSRRRDRPGAADAARVAPR